jgi:hypothetical protein
LINLPQLPDIGIETAFSTAQSTLGLDGTRGYKIPSLYFDGKEIITV